MQRIFDLIFSFFALSILLPLLLVIILILSFTGEREIFYLQKRVGKNKKSFKLIKFATMVKNSPNIGSGTITLKDDPRVLPFGKFLRKTKINELPQLINVLKGDMSFIGPRPLTNETFNYYQSPVQEKISKVRPGLSGIGSIFFRNEENLLTENNHDNYSKLIAPYKGSIEVWYVENRSLHVYFLCIFLTIFAVLFSKFKFPHYLFKGIPSPPTDLIKLIDDR